MGDPLGHNYELLEPIGCGTFGRVWRARTRNGEIVAAKLLRSEYATDAAVRTRFVREHTVLSAVRHAHIVGVRDLVIEGDVLALILEYVDGPSLRQLLTEQGTLAPPEAARLVAEVCDGLAVLHTAGILHRDVKPDNVLLRRGDDGRWHAKLGDFGLARMLRSSLTRTGAFTGTLEYAAPELAVGEPATAAADLYATGIVLYELLCGVTPFRAEHPIAVVQRHQSVPPPRPEGVQDQLWALIGGLLAKQAKQRPPNPGVVRDALTSLAPSLAGLPAAAALAEPPPPSLTTPPPSLTTAATAAPDEPPWFAKQPTVIGPLGRDGAASRRPKPVVRGEDPWSQEPGTRQNSRRGWLLASAALAAVPAVAVALVLTVAISRTTGQPIPTPAAGRTPQPTATLATAPTRATTPGEARPWFVDSLRSKARPWSTASQRGCVRSLRADGFHLTDSANSNSGCSTWAGFIRRVRDVSVSANITFRRSARFRNIPNASFTGASFAGVMCRERSADAADGYRATISWDGLARIETNPVSPAPVRVLGQATFTPSASHTHRIRFECLDRVSHTTHLLLTVDGVRVAEAMDRQRLGAGYVGMFVTHVVGSSGLTEVVFTDFAVAGE